MFKAGAAISKFFVHLQARLFRLARKDGEKTFSMICE
jgi:hypothetical protein